MRHVSRSLTIAGFTALYAYLVMLGATYGLLNAPVRIVSLVTMAVVAVVWLLVRWLNRWPWPRTALDGPVNLWLAAIGLSLALNPLPWRRELIGVWYVLAYIGVWYLLSDLVARGILRRERLMEILPIGGFVVVLVGYIQIQSWLFEEVPLILSGSAPLILPRPGSTLGNPNTLAGVLVVFVPIMVAFALRARGVVRVLAWLLTLASTLLMGLTFSRGGWVGLLAAFAVLGWLLLLDRGLVRPDGFRRWWSGQSSSVRAGLVTTLLVGALIVVAVLISLLVSLGQAGRTLDLRTFLYSAAINLFAEQPVAGHGLFTFGRGLAAQVSTPPWQNHSHAHNLILHVAAELGIAGLIALLGTLLAVLRAARANWQAASSKERILLSGAFAAVAGFVVHHQLDFPVIVPAVALTALIALVAACAPVTAPEPLGPVRGRLSSALGSALWVVVLVSGFWSTSVYIDYTSALSRGVDQHAYREAAEQMQVAIDRDPELAVQYYQQGFLYGVAAAQGDTSALVPATDAFQRYVDLEPLYATGWVNLSALQSQAGDRAAAAESLRRAVAAAPDHWPYQYLLARAEDASGNVDIARAFYQRVLETSPNLILYPDWAGSQLREELAATTQPTAVAGTGLLLEASRVEEAHALWDTVEDVDIVGYDAMAVEIWLMIAEGHVDEATAEWRELTWEGSHDGQAWLYFLEAQLASAAGDSDRAAEALAEAREALPLGLFENDDALLPNIHYIQYLYAAIARTYLPQVGYPLSSPLISHVLAQPNEP